jgi:hypothetical protein
MGTLSEVVAGEGHDDTVDATGKMPTAVTA